MSIWHWIILSLAGFLVVYPTWRIISRAGLQGPLAFFAILPIANLLLLWWLAFAPWPALKTKSHDLTVD